MTSFNQILHILRKDVRHLFPEITVSISLVALFAWVAPAGWPEYINRMSYPGAQFGTPQIMGGLLHALIPISWLVLISRSVHDESLVGDKQFWVTRPYTWYSLLAAKLLFILGFICVPLLAAQIFLVHYAGLPILATLPALLLNIGAISILFLLPFLVLASVTTSFGPLILLVLGGVLYIGVVGLVATYLSGAHTAPPNGAIVAFTLLTLILIGTLLYQYIERRTGLTQIVVLATPIFLAAVFLVFPVGPLFLRAYPAAGDVSAKLDLDPMKQQPTSGDLLHVGNNDVLSLPIEAASGSATTLLFGQAAQLELTSSSGFHWNSPWQSFSSIVTGGQSTQVNLIVPRTVVDRIGTETVKLQLTLALNRLQLDTPVNFKLSEADQAIPGGGVCSLVGEIGFAAPVCRNAMQAPLSFIETQAQDMPCGVEAPDAAPRAARTSMPAQHSPFAFDPVNAQSWRLSVAGDPPEGAHMHTICAGAPVKLTPTHEAGGVRVLVEQTGIELTSYLRHKASFSPAPGPR